MSNATIVKPTGSYYEFFAGGGMARSGLGSKWSCLFANDFDHKKCATYADNWGDGEICHEHVGKLTTAQLPGVANLAWASFPCQDLSLAGAGAGLKGERSGTFWPFWRVMLALADEDRAPDVIVLENVVGTLSSHGGKDFSTICSTLGKGEYRFGAMVIDAAFFTPQSRPRLFIIAVRKNLEIPNDLLLEDPDSDWHTKTLMRAYENLRPKEKRSWLWWNLKKPRKRIRTLAEIIEDHPDSVQWHTKSETKRLLSMMSDLNLGKVKKAMQSANRVVGSVYKRTRLDESGKKVQRAEVRFDNVAGCLRTPAGGSSRQLILVVEGKKRIRSRLISTRETARLMGLPESYILPEKYNEAYHLTGDGVVAPVVRHLAKHIIEPIVEYSKHQVGVAV